MEFNAQRDIVAGVADIFDGVEFALYGAFAALLKARMEKPNLTKADWLRLTMAERM